MTLPTDGEEPVSLRDLAARVIDDTKAYLQAELALVRQMIAAKAALAGPAAALIVVAIVLVQAAVTILAASLGLLLACWLGLAGGFAVAAVLVLALAGLLVWAAARRIKDIMK
ncbi:MAG TPA: phage holin family protein [Sphingomonas sp.]|nr:phage holin family protein [Sphingomonas sp.]